MNSTEAILYVDNKTYVLSNIKFKPEKGWLTYLLTAYLLCRSFTHGVKHMET